MLKQINISAALIIASIVGAPVVSAATTTLYENDFESGKFAEGTASPVWSIKVDNALGPVTRPGGIFEVVTGNAYSGKYSLRFNYDGLNGFCNLCGNTKVFQNSGYNNASYFVDSVGNDLSTSPYFASANRIVFNMDNGFSKWNISSVGNQAATNDKLTLALLGNNLDGGTSQFNSGDRVAIARQCGVDGTVGNNIDRRSDCNRAITYFNNVSQLNGQSIFRRLYFKIDTNAVLPSGVEKLRYWDTSSAAFYVTFVQSLTSPGDEQIQLGGVVTNMPRSNKPAGGTVKKGVWYYLEEQFTAESSNGANDGIYRLWFSPAGKESNTPLVEYLNIGLAPVVKASFWGNEQHQNDTHGYWYFDDFKIATTRIGPSSASVRPMAPGQNPIPAN